MEVPPGAGARQQAASGTTPQSALLRRAWLEAAATVHEQLPGLPALLESRLAALESARTLDETSLLAVAEEGAQYAMEQGAGDLARPLSKRLRRAIYEFLLALDAISPAESANAVVLPAAPVLLPPLPAEPTVAEAPRPPVAFAPTDVTGADDHLSAWLSPPAGTGPSAGTREVYRVATGDVGPRESDGVVLRGETDTPRAGGDAPDEVEEGEGIAEAPSAELDPAQGAWPGDAGPEVAPDFAAYTDISDGEEDPLAWATSGDAAASSQAPLDNGTAAPAEESARPPRDLLRVPRQFRRLPPLPGRRHAAEETADEFAANGHGGVDPEQLVAGAELGAPEADQPDLTADAGTAGGVDPAELSADGTFGDAAATADLAAAVDDHGDDPSAAADPEALGVHDETANAASAVDVDAATAPTDGVAAEAFAAGQPGDDAGAGELTASPEDHSSDAVSADPTAVAADAPAAEAAPTTADDQPTGTWAAADATAGDGAVVAADSAAAEAPAADDHSADGWAAAEHDAPAAIDDDDVAGVPALPWFLVPDPVAEGPASEVPQVDAAVIDEEPGVPFAPFAAPPVAAPPVEFPTASEAAADLPPAPDAAELHAQQFHTPVDLPRAPEAAEPQAPQFPTAAALPDAPEAGEPQAPHFHTAADLPRTPDAGDPQSQAPQFHTAADLPRAPELYEQRTPMFDPGAHPAMPPLETPAVPAAPFDLAAPAPQRGRFELPPLPSAPGTAQPDLPWSQPAANVPVDPFPIAPREGFHLADPAALDGVVRDPAGSAGPANPFTEAIPPVTLPPHARPAAQAPAGMPTTGDPRDHEDDAGAWRIRQSPRAQLLAERMAQKRREEAARAAFEAAHQLDEPGSGRRRRKSDDGVPDLPGARRQLEEHLRKKRGAEAAALLQRLAQHMGGREIADLALDAGDRCRALGQSRSATNCYLAAWRADPLYETPLWRLSDVCLNDQDIDLAVGYLERIAELMRSRGDDEGAIGVYRKIAMIAPERQDVRDVIRLAKSTGRLDG